MGCACVREEGAAWQRLLLPHIPAPIALAGARLSSRSVRASPRATRGNREAASALLLTRFTP